MKKYYNFKFRLVIFPLYCPGIPLGCNYANHTITRENITITDTTVFVTEGNPLVFATGDNTNGSLKSMGMFFTILGQVYFLCENEKNSFFLVLVFFWLCLHLQRKVYCQVWSPSPESCWIRRSKLIWRKEENMQHCLRSLWPSCSQCCPDSNVLHPHSK